MCRRLKESLWEKGIEATDSEILYLMQQRAYEVLKHFGINDIPAEGVPIVKIVKEAGIRVFKDDRMEGDFSAFIAIDPILQEQFGTNMVVCVNSRDSVEHMRFALAHELAHYLFDFDESKKVKYYNTYMANESANDNPIELRANKFAACLLMPEKEFRDAESHYSQNGIKYDTVTSLSRRFGVSPKAVYKRFEELGITGYEQ